MRDYTIIVYGQNRMEKFTVGAEDLGEAKKIVRHLTTITDITFILVE